MEDKIEKRFNELIQQGQELVQYLQEYWVDDSEVAKYQAWLGSSVNLLNIICRKDSYFVEESKRLITHREMVTGIPRDVVQKMLGVLTAAYTEWRDGLLREIEYIIFAETFDNFLDHAEAYHKSNKKIEASVLASSVLEDTVKKIALKNGMNPKGLSLDPLIDEMVKASVFTPVKAKRIKAYAGVRNHALHAEWDELDIRDTGEMIKGVRGLIEEFL